MKEPVPSITRIASVLVVVISLVVAVCVPLGYFLVSYENMQGSVNTELAFSARSVEGLVVRNPKTWQFEELRLREILENRLDYDVGQARAVKDMKGQVIAQTEESLTGPLVTFRAPVHDAGRTVANVEITRSINHLVVQTVIVGVSSVVPTGRSGISRPTGSFCWMTEASPRG